MKTKIFKFVLPAFAVLMAIGFAFATEAKIMFQQAYYQHPVLGWQPATADSGCGASGAIACEFNGYQLYSQPSLSSTALRKN
jgi:hypothetical protein